MLLRASGGLLKRIGASLTASYTDAVPRGCTATRWARLQDQACSYLFSGSTGLCCSRQTRRGPQALLGSAE